MNCRGDEFEQLIVDHMEHVQRTAHAFRVYNDSVFSHDDLVQAGYEGLVMAAWRYDPSRVPEFWAWAYRRVKGAMWDAWRAWYGRPIRNDTVSLSERISRNNEQEIGEVIACGGLDIGVMIEFWDLMREVPERWRRVAILCGMGERGQDVAACMGVSPARISQIRRHVRRHLTGVDRCGIIDRRTKW